MAGKRLKPCPFCGSTSVDVKYEFISILGYYAVCDCDEGGCGASSGYHETEEEAVEAWNRRAGEEE